MKNLKVFDLLEFLKKVHGYCSVRKNHSIESGSCNLFVDFYTYIHKYYILRFIRFIAYKLFNLINTVLMELRNSNYLNMLVEI